MSEKRYTKNEARQLWALDGCARFGHSWDIVATIQSGPHRIICGSCGWAGSVQMGDRPARPTGVTA